MDLLLSHPDDSVGLVIHPTVLQLFGSSTAEHIDVRVLLSDATIELLYLVCTTVEQSYSL